MIEMDYNENDETIFDLLVIHLDGLSRPEIVEELKISRTTIYDALVRLEKAGIVERFKKKVKHKGRKPVYWRIVLDGS